MTQAHEPTLEEIESTVAHAREVPAGAIRTGAASLGPVLEYFLADLCTRA